jgi:hypothetical protein
VEGVGEPRHLGVEPVLELQNGSQARQGLGSGERRQGLEGGGGDPQQGEPGAQAGPPPSSTSRYMK